MRRPNETLTVVDDSTRASGQLAALNTLLCASDAVYGTEFLFDLGWEFECRKSDAMASGYGCDDPMSLEITNSARSDRAVPGFIEQSVLNVRGKSASEEGAARGAYYDIRGMDYATGQTDYGWTPGRPYSWVDAYHHINFDKVRSNSTYQQEFNSWLTDSSIPSTSLLTDFGGGVTDGRNATPRH